MLWFEILRLFNEVQTLCVWDEELGIYIALLLRDLTGERERVAEVLPMLHTLMFRSFYQALPFVTPYLKPFIDARQLSGRPVAIVFERSMAFSRPFSL
jgi:hypothetical protein